MLIYLLFSGVAWHIASMVHACFYTLCKFSVDLVWQPDSLINMDVSYHFALRTIRPDQVVLTHFTFEIFKHCDQMAVAINNTHF